MQYRKNSNLISNLISVARYLRALLQQNWHDNLLPESGWWYSKHRECERLLISMVLLQANPSSSQSNANRHDNNKGLADRWMHLFFLPQAPQRSNTYLMSIIGHWCKRTWRKVHWKIAEDNKRYTGAFLEILGTSQTRYQLMFNVIAPQQLLTWEQVSPAFVTSRASY
jgi:hypothetical protein